MQMAEVPEDDETDQIEHKLSDGTDRTDRFLAHSIHANTLSISLEATRLY